MLQYTWCYLPCCLTLTHTHTHTHTLTHTHIHTHSYTQNHMAPNVNSDKVEKLGLGYEPESQTTVREFFLCLCCENCTIFPATTQPILYEIFPMHMINDHSAGFYLCSLEFNLVSLHKTQTCLFIFYLVFEISELAERSLCRFFGFWWMFLFQAHS